MKRIEVSSQYFNVKDTLLCGQIFRFFPINNGYLVISGEKACFAENIGDNAVVICEDNNEEYFREYFDLEKDYSKIVNSAIESGYEILKTSAQMGKGIRILNQNVIETLFSFIVSQNNNIPRIKGIIEKLCLGLGEKKSFNGREYHAFPTVEIMVNTPLDFYKSIGLGYRAPYVKTLAESLYNGFNLSALNALETQTLKKELVKIYGVGPKVADCVSLFGFNRFDSFPVDTWIEKVYRENFNGKESSRDKITKFFTDTFKEYSGYYQQYLFYYKRSLENK